jgi:di/tricarboxylate transporter
MDFVRDYHLAAREHRLRIGGHSPLVGRTLQQFAAEERAARLVAIERTTGSRRELLEPRGDTDLRAGDVLLVDFVDPVDDARAQELASLKLERLPLRGWYFTDQSRELGMVEVLLPPDSELIGRTVIEANLRRRYGLHAIGLRRSRTALEGGVAGERLRGGDVLLLFGRWKDIRALQKHMRDFLVLSLPAEIDQAVPAASRARYALASLLIMVILMVTGWVPNVLAALLACLLMALGGCLSLDSAYRSIQWPSLILIVGMMPFATALERTGGVELAVAGLIRVFGDAEPRIILAALFSLTAMVGLFISNTATAVLVSPIALSAARELHVSPYPFVMTVALAASAAFMTPVSSPVNTLVMVPGRYHFGDFVRIGVPFTLIVLVITVVLVPWLLPLRP